MLYLIGLGLHDETELSIRSIMVLKRCEKVYLEGYTSLFNGSMEKLEVLICQKVEVLKRIDVEENPQKNILSDGGDRALLVLGDPLVATTHSDIMLRAKKLGIEVKIIHNSSVFSAIAETGLQIYKFGRTTTIAYPEGNYFPKSPYDVIWGNKSQGLHTLCLLDIKSDENRFMSVNEGIDLLLRMENERLQNQIRENTLCVGVSRLGGDSIMVAGTTAELLNVDFGCPPHCLVVCGKLHHIEEEMLDLIKVKTD